MSATPSTVAPSSTASPVLSPCPTLTNLSDRGDCDKSILLTSPPTLIGLADAKDDKLEKPLASDPSPLSADEKTIATATPVTKAKFSQRKKWGLLGLFSLAFFIDIWCYSAFFIFTAPITADLDILFTQQSWIITSYAVTFASFLLFWGRLSDLYSATPVFNLGFAVLGLLSLITSFLPDKYSFFVFRALAGIAGSTLIPASYRLITHVFETHELEVAFTIYGMTGAIANVTGTLIAGIIQLIPGTGQMAAWRWFFRILAIIVMPVSLLAFFVVPHQSGTEGNDDEDNTTTTVEEEVTGPKWRRLDLVGSLLILAATILLILGLTFGASYGWKTPDFLVPFLLAFILFPAFFVWEARLPATHALIPTATWRIPNFMLFVIFGLQIYGWWGVNFLALVETFTSVHHESAILAAVRVLPEGITAFCLSLLIAFVPAILKHPRWPIAIGSLLGIVGYILFTRPGTSADYVSTDYWRYIFPGMILGSGGTLVAFNGTNVAIMTSVPAHMAGVAGAVLQTAYQVGSVVAFSVQAGLFTVNPGSIANADNVKASFYFQLGWGAIWLIGFLAVYRQPKKVAGDEENAAPAFAH